MLAGSARHLRLVRQRFERQPIMLLVGWYSAACFGLLFLLLRLAERIHQQTH
ncbi:hypothetical protein [Sulfuricystis thermophila]|uniref:hypothetical protein n=1 Tax=Sulfuricystis thermophila TaxID=2496847 RepID=UPI00155876B0|nr:hypothetical protein [Sulfuricystis thermophila]